LVQILIRLSNDGTVEVQRAAVLGLGRIDDPTVLDRLFVLVEKGRPVIRAAAARSLALLARSGTSGAAARYKQIIPTLQKALEDPALEVVVEAAEDLGALGAGEAGPVLTGLLAHPSETVRQTAAQALARVADAALLEWLLDALTDSSAAIRFSVVGACGHAANDGSGLPEPTRRHLLARLESLLVHDTDPGVRSRAATVLGECGTAATLPGLWRCVTAGEDGRVQEKSWAAFVEILSRAANLPLLREWDQTLSSAKQYARRLQMLSEVANRWQKGAERPDSASAALEMLVQAQLEQGKWTAAFPQVRELLARPANDAEILQRLRWLQAVGEQALRDGNRAEAIRAVQEAHPYLQRAAGLSAAFEKLERQATAKE
jgi:HEAT repeat protein